MRKFVSKIIRPLLAIFALSVVSGVIAPAYAASYVPAGARITQVATSELYRQNAVIFKLDKGTSDCAAGSYAYFHSANKDELKAIFTSVLGAYLTGTQVIVHFSSGCEVDGFGLGAG